MEYVVSTRNGPIHFNSDLTDREAFDRLRADDLTKPFNDFRQSLIRAYESGRITERQRPWLVKLAQDSMDDDKAALIEGPFKALHEPFEVAGLRRLTMRYGDLSIRRAPNTGANQGHLYVFWGESYRGKITPNGTFKGYRQPGLEKALEEVAVDPIGAALKYGRETGKCSCCGRSLSDPVSVFGGIGPVCLGRVAGEGARKALQEAFKNQDVDQLTEALRRRQFYNRQNEEKTEAKVEVDRTQFKDENDYMLAKALGGL